MKRLKIGMLAAATMLLATSTGAQAASGVLDFQGFTITYNATGQWDRVSLDSEDSATRYNIKCDFGNHCTPLGGGVEYDFAGATFGASRGPELQSYNGQGNSSLQSIFSYTVQAKAGWQMTYLDVNYRQSGSYLGFKGGTTSISLTGGASVTGGDPYPGIHAYTSDDVAVSDATIHSGTWGTYYILHAQGNDFDGDSEPVYDSNGKDIGYTKTYSISDRYRTPLTGATGSFTQTLSASTTGAGQTAYVAGLDPTSFYINAHAVRLVSAVPEPDSYAMMAASLGLIGFAARRKSKRAA